MVLTETDKTMSEIEVGFESESDWDVDDLANAMMIPYERLQIAIRAVYHELASVIEHELQNVAKEPWAQERHVTAPAPAAVLLENLDSAEYTKWLKQEVVGGNFKKVRGLIENYYPIKLKDLEGYSEIMQIRTVANDLKHRKGRVDNRPDSHNIFCFEKHELTAGDAKEAIEVTGSYFDALWKITDEVDNNHGVVRQ